MPPMILSSEWQWDMFEENNGCCFLLVNEKYLSVDLVLTRIWVRIV